VRRGQGLASPIGVLVRKTKALDASFLGKQDLPRRWYAGVLEKARTGLAIPLAATEVLGRERSQVSDSSKFTSGYVGLRRLYEERNQTGEYAGQRLKPIKAFIMSIGSIGSGTFGGGFGGGLQVAKGKSAADVAGQEATETAAVTRAEASKGDRQAIAKLARQDAAGSGQSAGQSTTAGRGAGSLLNVTA